MSELSEEKRQLVTCCRGSRRPASSFSLLPASYLESKSETLMNKVTHSTRNGLNADLRSIDSIYRMIVVAGLRSKQLLRGGTPRILPDPSRRRNISIALEEARRGLINFTIVGKENGKAAKNSAAEVRKSVA
jgi:DNA-directed RNA polymerase omega subunit